MKSVWTFKTFDEVKFIKEVVRIYFDEFTTPESLFFSEASDKQ